MIIGSRPGSNFLRSSGGREFKEGKIEKPDRLRNLPGF